MKKGVLALLAAASLAAVPVYAQDAVAPAAPAEPASLEKPVNLWPLVYQRRTPDSFELELLFSLFAYERERGRTSLAVRPLYFRELDRDKDTERRHILWPLSVYKRKGSERSLWILPLFWRRANEEMSRTVFFPLYHRKVDGQVKRTGLVGFIPVTLFDFQRDEAKDRTYHRYILWTYERTAERSHASFLPFYEQTLAPGVKSFSLIPLVAWFKDENADASRFSMLGLPDTWNLFEVRRQGTTMKEWHFLILYRHVSTEARRLVLFPVYWDLRRGRDRTFHFWPLYGKKTSGAETEYSTVWPLFRWRVDEAEGEREANVIWPLIRTFRGREGESHTRFFPLFARTAKPASEERPPLMGPGLVLPVPLFYRATGEGYDNSRFFWLAWFLNNKERKMAFVVNYYSIASLEEDRRHRGLFPLWHTSRWSGRQVDFVFPTYIGYRDEERDLRTFFPIYYRWRTGESGWETLFPLYYDYRAEQRKFRVIFPFYWHARNDAERTEFSYWFPLYGTFRRGETTRRHLFLFPLYARVREQETGYRSWDALWPLLHHASSPTGGSTRVLPFYWSGRDAESSFRVAFPVLWQFKSPKGEHKHVFPLTGRYRGADGFRLSYVAGPMYVSIDDEKQKQSRRAYAGFLAGSVRDYDIRRDWFFPFYWRKRGADESRFFLLPFFGRETIAPQYSTTFFIGFKKGINLFEFTRDPGIGYSESRALLYYARQDGGGSVRVLFPLYWRLKGDRKSLDLLFPLYAWQRDKDKKQTALSVIGLHDGLSLMHFVRNETEPRRLDRVGIVFRDRRGDKSMTGVFPLFWHAKEPGRTRSVLFPLYNYGWNEEAGRSRFGLLGFTPVFSLFTTRDEPNASVVRLWPLFGYRTRHRLDEKQLGILGVYYPASIVHFRWGSDVYDHHLFPLYSYERDGRKGDPKRNVKGSLLWQVVSYKREGTEATDFRFLWRLVRKSRSGGRRTIEVNPFWFRIQDEKQGTYWAVLGGLLGKETRPDGAVDWRFLWFL